MLKPLAMVRPDVLAGMARFPVPAAAALFAATLIMLWLERVIAHDSAFQEQALFGAAAAFAAGVAAAILLDGRSRATALTGQLAALVTGAVAASGLFSIWLTPPMLMAGLVLLTIAAPGFARGTTPTRFWVFNIRAGFTALVGAVGAGAFVLGFWAILITLQSLFDLHLPLERLISHAATAGFVVVLPLYWLAFQPRVEAVPAEEPTPDLLLRAVAALTDFIFIPLLFTYAVILHVYAAKIALNMALPRGQIGLMVSIFLSLGYLAFVLATPRQSPLPRMRDFFRTAWSPATLIPVILLALALWERVQAYGVTEERYVLGLAAVAGALLILAWLPQRRLDPRLVPAVAAVLLLVGATGPLSAQFLTVHSQARRFVQVVNAPGGFADCRLNAPSSPATGEADLRSIVQTLERRRALHLIAPALGMPAAATGREIRACLGFDGPRPSPAGPEISFSYVRIDSDLLLGPFSAGGSGTVVFRAPDSPDYTFKVEGQRGIVSGPAGSFVFDLSDQAGGPGAQPRLVRTTDGRVVLILRGFTWHTAGAERTIGSLRGEILLRNAVP